MRVAQCENEMQTQRTDISCQFTPPCGDKSRTLYDFTLQSIDGYFHARPRTLGLLIFLLILGEKTVNLRIFLFFRSCSFV